jgi:hypothetical protein
MKMKTTLLTIALLTTVENMDARNDRSKELPKGLMPSAATQKEARSVYNQIETLTVKDGTRVQPPAKGASIELSADFISHLGDTLSVAYTMSSEEGKKIEQLQLAYAQIDTPYWRQDLNELMGDNTFFMNALAKYDSAFTEHQQLSAQLGQLLSTRPTSDADFSDLWNDIINNDESAAIKELKEFMTPVSIPAAQQSLTKSTLKKLMESSFSLKNQLATLQTLFKEASSNKPLMDHMKKIEYLVKQNVQWMIAFGMAINPDFAKTVTSEMTDHLTTTLTNLHTSPQVAALQKMQATVSKK